MLEIEKKFLVDSEKWSKIEKPEPIKIIQAYLSDDKKSTVRVRIKNNKAFLTVKGQSVGISRLEYEYEIPVSDAQEMIQNMCNKVISKKRYEIVFDNHTWEVDEFEETLAPLILAEIELKSENEIFSHPDFITIDVSTDVNYFNSNLIKKA